MNKDEITQKQFYFLDGDKERIYNQFLTDVKHEVKFAEGFVDNGLVDRLTKMDELGHMDGKVCFLLDFSSLEYKFMNKGVKKVLGYPAEEFINVGFRMAFQLQPKSNSSFFNQVAKWFSAINELNPITGFDKYYSSGYVLTHKSGKDVPFFAQVDRFLGEDLKPKAIFSTMIEVSHLIKSKTSWIKFMSKEKTIGCYNSIHPEKHYDEFFTKREKEVLELLSVHSTEEIAAKMGIAVETLNRHKKNMLSKLDAKNTTSLIQLAKMSHIL